VEIKALIERGDQLFSKRGSLLSLWQEQADQFYPERADFTVTRTLGDDFASHLTTSYPTMVRRDLGNSLGTMMRPTNIDWFHMRTEREDEEDQPAKAWLERATQIQKRAMYDKRALFTRASKESDHDVASFGQSVKTVELNRNADGLLYRCWHLRDCAWSESAEGQIDTVHRKWKPTASMLMQIFKDKCHEKVKDCVFGAKKEPYREFNVRHIVMPSEEYGDPKWLGRKADGKLRTPYVSVYIDVDNQHEIECVGQSYFMYVIPRWQTVSGSQYAFSPATVCALPDARLLQAMTRTLLEAGEKYTNPPMIAVQEAIRSDIAIYAGGITWIDAAYDEKTGEVLRPLSQDKSGIPLGMDMARDVRAMINEAFFLSKLSLPERGPEMTAYEVGQRVQDYIRQASPLFEPLEDEDNGAMCETTFELLMRHGAFGSYEDIPQSIRGKDIKFRFESPLHDAIERQKGTKFMEAMGLLAQVAQAEPAAAEQLDIVEAFRDTLLSIGIPAKWARSEEDVAQRVQAREAETQAQTLLQSLGQGAEVATQIGLANQALAPEAIAA
jgi:hypothetical protein